MCDALLEISNFTNKESFARIARMFSNLQIYGHACISADVLPPAENLRIQTGH